MKKDRDSRSRHVLRVVFTAAAVFISVAPAGLAQTSGTVEISGTVAAAVKITSGGAATLAGNVGGGVTTQSAADTALATVVNFGDVGPGNSNNYVCFTQPLFLRANAASVVSGAVTVEAFGPGSTDLHKSDIGVGLRNLAAGGANADISTTAITAAFSSDPCAAAKNVDGVPIYSATLAGLATSAPGTTLITSTGPISLRGSFSSPNNRALADLKLAIAPQTYAAGPFSATVTFTMTTP